MLSSQRQTHESREFQSKEGEESFSFLFDQKEKSTKCVMYLISDRLSVVRKSATPSN